MVSALPWCGVKARRFNSMQNGPERFGFFLPIFPEAVDGVRVDGVQVAAGDWQGLALTEKERLSQASGLQ